MKKLFPLFLIFFNFNSFSQSSAEVSKNLFSINFLLPSLEYETKIFNNSTLNLNLGTGFALVGGEIHNETKFGLFPNLSAQYRNYYNLERRLSKNKNISNNSGNYFGLHSAIYGGNPIIGDLEFTSNYAAEVGPVWGLHRVYNNGFKLNLNLGLGYGFNDQRNSSLVPLVGFQLGWLISNF